MNEETCDQCGVELWTHDGVGGDSLCEDCAYDDITADSWDYQENNI